MEYKLNDKYRNIRILLVEDDVQTLEKLNDILKKVYTEIVVAINGSDALIANIPFFLEVELDSNSNSILTSKNVTNFGDYTYRNKIVNLSNYRKLGYKKASSDLKPWATAQRDIKVVLALYFR